MLLELRDLKDYADALAKRLPRIAQRVTIREPGTSEDELSVLDEAIKLPPIYKRCICKFNFFGVSIGYFSTWPGSIKAGNMIEALRNANQGGDLRAIATTESPYVIVAQEEANLICVGRSDSSNPDTVYLLDVMRSTKIEQLDVAPDFEKFLLLAGNLHDISFKYEGDASAGMAMMLECCLHFGCTDSQIAFWNSRAEMMLS